MVVVRRVSHRFDFEKILVFVRCFIFWRSRLRVGWLLTTLESGFFAMTSESETTRVRRREWECVFLYNFFEGHHRANSTSYLEGDQFLILLVPSSRCKCWWYSPASPPIQRRSLPRSEGGRLIISRLQWTSLCRWYVDCIMILSCHGLKINVCSKWPNGVVVCESEKWRERMRRMSLTWNMTSFSRFVFQWSTAQIVRT